MTRERAKELLPLIQAFAEGKTIQFWDYRTKTWNDEHEPFLVNGNFRIKPDARNWWLACRTDGTVAGFFDSLEAAQNCPRLFTEIVHVREVL